ncbi:toll/interleukin-1 receptor domain-containing protein [Algoriphagus lutimaris]|uniref:toll/interleukin-1 receptor domain-containing protein n=1 Tax=Algoriphagus lutimaris TaxID=613197 RepID=UPI00196B4811|nr:toll/interleukin-1 receptor domain-containing protein [Algoriphagus lutimaris]MBN3519932.1 toll/interleukin-1 receptor domain-containing protein [Algoriphagus lutimaris]
MEDSTFIHQVEQFLLTSNSKWNTSQGILQSLQIASISPLELDEMLLKAYQKSRDHQFRYSTLPSKKSLDVLWGHIDKVKKREGMDFLKQDQELLLDELNRSAEKSMFLSHSFKDSDKVVDLAKALAKQDLHLWLAETDLLYHQHINSEVKTAIEKLPFFAVFLSENIFHSIWSAKEIEFALNNKKQIIGFFHAETLEKLLQINSKSSIAQELFSRFFDNHQEVIFVNYPSEEHSISFPLGEFMKMDELVALLK